MSRSTFFRAFGSKDDVIFPRHDELQARIEARLDTGTAPDLPRRAARGGRGWCWSSTSTRAQVALSRYRLTRTVPALRDREMASMLGYQRLFREHLRGWLAELGGPDVDLHAELLAASVVTAHNVVLRRWLRGETDRPVARVRRRDGTCGPARRRAGTRPTGRPLAGTTVVVLRGDRPVEDVLESVRRALSVHRGGQAVSLPAIVSTRVTRWSSAALSVSSSSRPLAGDLADAVGVAVVELDLVGVARAAR